MENKYWIQGRPATFATNHERPWRTIITSTLLNCKNEFNELELYFKISQENYLKYAFDVDNLCEPVFAEITSKLCWYESKRVNISKYKVSKAIDVNEGLLLIDTNNCTDIDNDGIAVFDQIYTGGFPNKASEPHIIDWLKSLEVSELCLNQCKLRLQFGSNKISIATISSGKVKPIIDALYPILGGTISAPDDHKIVELLVEKGIGKLEDNQVRVTLWNC